MDEETISIFDETALLTKKEKITLHPVIAQGWQKILKNGLEFEKRSVLLEKHPRSGNCPIYTPKLNPVVKEILSSNNKTVSKRDYYLSIDQDLCGSSLSALGSAINMIFDSQKTPINSRELLTNLSDAGKMLCELHNQLSKARKHYIIPCFKPKAKVVLKETETNELLFGSEIEKKLKYSMQIEKLGDIMKKANSKKPVFRASGSLNWQGPLPFRKQQQADNRLNSFQNQRAKTSFNKRQSLTKPSQSRAESTSATIKK